MLVGLGGPHFSYKVGQEQAFGAFEVKVTIKLNWDELATRSVTSKPSKPFKLKEQVTIKLQWYTRVIKQVRNKPLGHLKLKRFNHNQPDRDEKVNMEVTNKH